MSTPADRIQALRDADVLGFKTDVRLGTGADEETGVRLGPFLADDAALDARLALIGRDAGTDHPGVSSGWFMEKQAWLASCAVAASLLHDGAVPPLDDEQTRIVFGDHELPEVLVVGPDGWVEAADGDEEMRLRVALERVEEHLTPLADALVARRMRPRGGLWRQAGDQLAASFLWWGQAFDRLDEGRRLGERILAMDSPLRVKPGFTTTDIYGPTMPWRIRASCCLAYHVPEQPLCDYCPRLEKEKARAGA